MATDYFLGEASERIARYADRLVWKPRYDAVMLDIEECYAVCEERGATLPDEQTPQNLKSTI